MEDLEYGDCFREPSAADAIIDQAIKKLGTLFKSDVRKAIKEANAAGEKVQELNSTLTGLRLTEADLQQKIKELNDKIANIEGREYPKAIINNMLRSACSTFVIGQAVYHIERKCEDAICPLCGGKKTVSVLTDGVAKGEIKCPTCSGRGMVSKGIAIVKPRTISEIILRLCFHEKHVSYWSTENIYLAGSDYACSVTDLFETEEAARAEITRREGKE